MSSFGLTIVLMHATSTMVRPKLLIHLFNLIPLNHIFTLHEQRERGKVIGCGVHIREYDSTLYVGLARAVSPINTNFRLTFLLTRLQEALYEDITV